MSNYENYINTNCHKFNESILLSEIAWNNIMISFMNKEYNILKEDSNPKSNSLLDKIKEWFKKIIEWCKALVLKIKQFLQKITLKTVIKKMIKFIDLNKDKLAKKFDELNDENNHEFQIHNWKSDYTDFVGFPRFVRISTNFSIKTVLSDVDKEIFKNNDKFNEYLEKDLSFFNNDEKSTISFNRYSNIGSRFINNIKKDLELASHAIIEIEKDFVFIDREINKINSISKQSMNNNDESTIKRNKEDIITLKEKIIYKNKILIKFYKIINCYVSDCGKIISACKS